MVDVLFELPQLMRDYTVIGFDQRGTGAQRAAALQELERDGRLRSTSRPSGARSGSGPSARSTRRPDTVEDMEAIRQRGRARAS